ncbi:MAG: hypothetical protein KGH67_03415 [Candidatus Micrarchaeota archaeon]|nr:hypothetical protein [Candidatus Micrarchaeota archaeon]MDE1859551.1 hypothetical protein [Candidatus Micrarchaeota archaeon]
MAAQKLGHTAQQIPVRVPLIKATLVVVRDIPKSFANGLTTQSKSLGVPDYDKLVAQQKNFTDALESLQIKVLRLPADEKNPDSQFPRDTIISYKGVMLECNPGSDKRRKEVSQNVSDLKNAGIFVEKVKYVNGAFVEGGDVLTFDDQHLVLMAYSGRNENIRTNKEGIAALSKALRAVDPDVTVIAVPHVSITGASSYKPTMILHVETGFTPMTSKLALQDPQCHVAWNHAYYPLPKSKEVQLPPWNSIHLPENEGYGAHVLPINGSIVIAKGFPTVKQLAAQHYEQVIEVDMSEAQKMDGSLRCWTILHNEN